MRSVAIHAITTYSGADVFFETLGSQLQKNSDLKCTVCFHKPWYRFFPALLQRKNIEYADVIVTNIEYGFALRKKCGTLIATSHQCVFDAQYEQSKSLVQKIYHRFFLRPFTEKTLRSADIITACSDSVASLLREQFGEYDIKTVHNGVDTRLFSPKNNRSKSCDKRKILFVGNFIKRKGIGLLPEIADALDDAYVIRCVSGKRKLKIPSSLRHPRIECVRSMNRESLAEEYRSADVVIVPSVHEGFGYVAAEAMACATPCIVSGANGLQEIAGDAAIQCSDGSVKSYVDTIRKICEDETVRNTYALKGRERIESMFSLEKHTDAFTRLICES